MREAGK